MVDETKLHQFVGQMLSDLGGAASVALVRIGDALGLYKTMHERGPMTVAELAAVAGVNQRYLREWLSHQAASNYVSYDPATQKFTLPPEQAMVFAIEDSPVFMIGAFVVHGLDSRQPAKGRAGVQDRRRRVGGAIRRPVCSARWRGFSALATTTIWSATGCPRSTASSPNWKKAPRSPMSAAATAGLDRDDGAGFPELAVRRLRFSPELDRARPSPCREHGVSANCRFEVGTAKDYPERDFDLVAFFDCLHDMGDPAGAAAHVRQSLKPDGSWMIVEPMAGDRLEDNLNPIGRIYYAASTMVCVPTSLSQEVGAALGAQAGEAKLREVITAGGFRNVRRATETPFNMILEARA